MKRWRRRKTIRREECPRSDPKIRGPLIITRLLSGGPKKTPVGLGIVLIFSLAVFVTGSPGWRSRPGCRFLWKMMCGLDWKKAKGCLILPSASPPPNLAESPVLQPNFNPAMFEMDRDLISFKVDTPVPSPDARVFKGILFRIIPFSASSDIDS
jgi:hypothetical protein